MYHELTQRLAVSCISFQMVPDLMGARKLRFSCSRINLAKKISTGFVLICILAERYSQLVDFPFTSHEFKNKVDLVPNVFCYTCPLYCILVLFTVCSAFIFSLNLLWHVWYGGLLMQVNQVLLAKVSDRLWNTHFKFQLHGIWTVKSYF